MSMRNIVIKISYLGTNYSGWQVQPNAESISEMIINAIYKITKTKVNLYGSGRTDAGVHAYGQVANFYTESNIAVEKFPSAINAFLPKDIVIIDAWEEVHNFNSRFNAKSKTYEYKVLNSNVQSPFWVDRAWQVGYELDLELMKKATEILIGEHDFRSFMASGSSVKDTVRTIYSLDISKTDELITFRVSGSGFLYNMVRIIVGLLISVGRGKVPLSRVSEILEVKDRTKGEITAPSCGLYLVKVEY